ncbi:YobI family P-loop NTPase [Ruegeria arenilitoris]|uniref:YobI family P-loop NTPase n=1 Tax=Ruegeria arenilitoris TaxID=1173585 RepID=UPI00147EF967|nr:ATP-binding protein [Ruegeria arenilitoris]
MKVFQNFFRLVRASTAARSPVKFVDLAPTSKADEEGIYFEALSFATNNPDVSNIALTGPYGSGKSSVIKSFLSKYSGNALQISLAAFLPEADVSEPKPVEDDNDPTLNADKKISKISKQEIERSILQQMLYGADANKLPLSRFKRIQSPNWWAGFVSLLIVLGGISIWYLFQNRTELLTGEFFKPLDRTNWFNLGVFLFGFLFLWRLFHHIYLKSFGLSLKGISLKDIEITPEVAQEESILNRHLDEIIYFFQSTSYDLVIIEDLDRFDNPDIFVTLREINSLINANAGVKHPVRFLYALRDDMFATTDRTKFFEFIVPIVPIINHSNSIDKVLEQGQRLSLDDRLDAQFLREVSRYLNDLRLITNIFNEYAIYVANLESDEEEVLDPNRLLAVLIYKNVLPQDFERLHQQKSVLSKLLSRYDDLIASAESKYRNQILTIEAEIAEAKKQLPNDIDELKRIYAMALIEKLPAGSSYVRLGNDVFSLAEISKHTQFDAIIFANQLQYAPQRNGPWSSTKLAGLEHEVDAHKTFAERKSEIERKSEENLVDMGQKTKALRSKIGALRTQKFSEVIRINSSQVLDCFADLGDNAELMKFLVFEGYLDDSYYQYTSLFHSGRLSPNDNKFLIQIRSFNTPDPDFQIDNPAEVVAAMREEDFGQSFVLNRNIMDFLLEDKRTHQPYVERAIEYISSDFDQCEQFFSSYYERGRYVQRLISDLVTLWPRFATAALQSKNCVAHAARLIAFAPPNVFGAPPFAGGEMADFFSKQTAEVLREGVDFDLSRLELMQVSVEDLSKVIDFPAVVEFLINQALYLVSIENIQFVFERSGRTTELSELNSGHYTTVLNSGDEGLISLVEGNFNRYVQRVLLALEGNTREEESAILAALQHEEVATEHLQEFFVMQTTRVKVLAQVPSRFRAAALEHRLIEATWANCLTFQTSESGAPNILSEYLMHSETLKTLSEKTIPDDKEAQSLREFIFHNDDFDPHTYRTYVGLLPKEFRRFPDKLAHEKLLILIEEAKVSFSVNNFQRLGQHRDLQVLFVAQNFDAFVAASDDFDIDDDFRMDLLDTDLSDEHKQALVLELDPLRISGEASHAEALISILEKISLDSFELTYDLVQALVPNLDTSSAQIELLNKFHGSLSNDEIKEVIKGLSRPYSDIASLGKSPRIKNTAVNRAFVDWLSERRVISSWKKIYLDTEIRVNTFRTGARPEGASETG